MIKKQQENTQESAYFLQNYLLLEAVGNNKVERVKEFLQANLGADIHYKDDCALNVAISKNHPEMVEFLLFSPELKENVCLKNPNNANGLKQAIVASAKLGNDEIITYLLSNETTKSFIVKEDILYNLLVIYEKFLPMIKVMLKQTPEFFTTKHQDFLMNSACLHKNYEMIEFFIDNKIGTPSYLTNIVVKNFIDNYSLRKKLEQDTNKDKAKNNTTIQKFKV